jgi:DNA-binding NarL/FixJ family response regulator
VTDDHASLRALAAEFGASPSTIAKMVRKAEGQRPQVKMIMGRDGKMRPDRRYDITARDALIVDLRSAGFLMREIASEVSCSVGTVHRVISRAY